MPTFIIPAYKDSRKIIECRVSAERNFRGLNNLFIFKITSPNDGIRLAQKRRGCIGARMAGLNCPDFICKKLIKMTLQIKVIGNFSH